MRIEIKVTTVRNGTNDEHGRRHKNVARISEQKSEELWDKEKISRKQKM